MHIYTDIHKNKIMLHMQNIYSVCFSASGTTYKSCMTNIISFSDNNILWAKLYTANNNFLI